MGARDQIARALFSVNNIEEFVLEVLFWHHFRCIGRHSMIVMTFLRDDVSIFLIHNIISYHGAFVDTNNIEM